MINQELENLLVNETEEERAERMIKVNQTIAQGAKWISGWSMFDKFLNDNMQLFHRIVKEKEGIFQEFLQFALDGTLWCSLDELYNWIIMFMIQTKEDIINYIEKDPLGILCCSENVRDRYIDYALSSAYKRGSLLELANELNDNKNKTSQLAKFQNMSDEQLLIELTHHSFIYLHSEKVCEYIVKRLEKIYL